MSRKSLALIIVTLFAAQACGKAGDMPSKPRSSLRDTGLDTSPTTGTGAEAQVKNPVIIRSAKKPEHDSTSDSSLDAEDEPLKSNLDNPTVVADIQVATPAPTPVVTPDEIESTPTPTQTPTEAPKISGTLSVDDTTLIKVTTSSSSNGFECPADTFVYGLAMSSTQGRLRDHSICISAKVDGKAVKWGSAKETKTVASGQVSACPANYAVISFSQNLNGITNFKCAQPTVDGVGLIAKTSVEKHASISQGSGQLSNRCSPLGFGAKTPIVSALGNSDAMVLNIPQDAFRCQEFVAE